MRVLFIGDIFGEPGREVLKKGLTDLKEIFNPDFIIANGENAAHGAGITYEIAKELFSFGLDVLTGGNHIFDKRAIWDRLNELPYLLRPANFPEGVPGKGYVILYKGKLKLGVISLQGRIEMAPIDSPFAIGDSLIEGVKKETPAIIIDFHAEATAEKKALGYYFEGRVSAVIGTHTHVQTADEEIFKGGTAYISDVGMCGVHDSVIGLEKEVAIKRFITQMPWTFKPAEGKGAIDYVVFDILDNGKSSTIKRGQWKEQ